MTKKMFNTVINYKGRNYRYNSEESQLEWVTLEDFDWESEDNNAMIQLDEPEVIDSIGLNVENAEGELMGYIAGWHEDINEELKYDVGY